MPELCIIAAMDEYNGIGFENRLPWDKIPQDFKRFRDLTIPYSLVMGRRTADSVIRLNNGQLLPHRHNFVVTRNPNFHHLRANVAASIEDAIHMAMQYEEERIAIIGGGQIFEQAINMVDRLYLTVIMGRFEADTFFPDYKQFQSILDEQAGEYNGYRYKFLDLARSD